MKKYIVTGTSQGIGKTVSQILLRNDSLVFGVSRSPSTITHPNYTHFQTDLGQCTSATVIFQKFIDHFDTLDGLVLNAGQIDPISPLGTLKIDDFKQLMQVNVYSQLELLQYTLPLLRCSKGSVVFVSSGASIQGYPTWGAYCISKAAFNILATTLSKEESELYSVSVRPGVVDTNMQDFIRTKSDVMPDEFYKKFRDLKERNELLDPEKPAKAIARLVLFPIKELNGQFVQWDAIDVSDLK